MKIKKILLFLLIPLIIYSRDYKIFLIDKKLTIQDENGLVVSQNLRDFFKNLRSGDRVFFKRGDVFNQKIVLKNKDHITISSFGDESKKAIITSISKIPFDENASFELFYSKGSPFSDTNDSSFSALKREFLRHYLLLSTETKRDVAKSFKEVEDEVDYILRIKLPVEKFEYFDPNAVRLWFDGKEILKLMLFEELRCECGEYVRWYLERSENYLYIFIKGPFIDPALLKRELKINNINIDTVSIQDSENIFISDLDIRGGKYALALRGSSFVNISNCDIGKGSFVGVEITSGIDSNTSSDHNVIDSCEIDSRFRFKNYRYHSSRGSQDGVFIVGEGSYNKVLNSYIKDWGHSGINIYSNDKEAVYNQFVSNRIDGDGVAYMHGFTVEGEKCKYNGFFSNFFTNLGARNQLGGVENAVYKNYFGNIYNSQVKKDQGYGSGQGIWLQTFAKRNYISENIFIGCDEAAISLVSFGNDGIKEKNTISRNFIINCGMRIFNKPYNNCVIEIYDKDDKRIRENNFINNRVFLKDATPLIYYHGEEYTLEEFNAQIGRYGDFIIGNLSIK